MRPTVISTGLILCAITIASGTQQAQALSNETLLASMTTNTLSLPVAIETKKKNLSNNAIAQLAEVKPKAAETAKPTEPIKYKIEPNDSLDKIANKYQTTWVRLFAKNTQIVNPDLIKVNEEIVIPSAEEVLEPRQEPTPVIPPASTPQSTSAPARTKVRTSAPAVKQNSAQPRASAARGSSSGNTYTAGYCTWYVKNRRPDLPNNLGNANTWVARASAQGLSTGSAPRAGAVGQRGMHVVYVESVNGDGTVNISEMNRVSVYVTSSRTVPASYFQYIY